MPLPALIYFPTLFVSTSFVVSTGIGCCLYCMLLRRGSTQLKAEVSLTSSTLEDTRTTLAREGAVRSQLDLEVSALRLDRERDLRDLRAAHSAELTAAREDGVRRAEEAAAARSSEVCMYFEVCM